MITIFLLYIQMLQGKRKFAEKDLHFKKSMVQWEKRIPWGPILEVYIMAYKIGEDCISCGLCASNCPVEAIAPGDDHYVIDPDTCIECGTCADNCPVEAITQE